MSAEASPHEAAAGETAAGEKERQRKRRWETLVEIAEVLVLAIVAVATSYSGYAAARWDGRQAFAQRFKVRAVRITTTAIALALAAYTVVDILTLPRT